MIITKFKLFLEARLSDLLKVKGDSDIASEIRRLSEVEFDFSKNLTKFITLKKRLGNKKIQFSINWNDTATHSLNKRIRERTSFKSIEEFNNFFKEKINQIFPDKVGKELFSNARYSIYSEEYNLSIVFYFSFEDFMNGKYEISVITILPGKKGDIILELD